MRGAALLVSFVLIGCCDSGGHPPAAPAITLGAMDAAGTFTNYTDGQDVVLVAGAQGGFHVWMAYRLAGVAAGSVPVERRAHRLSDDALVLRYDHTATIGDADASGFYQSPAALPMFMCPSPVGLSVIDTPIVFTLDVGGASGSVTLVPHCPDDQRDFCQRICTG